MKKQEEPEFLIFSGEDKKLLSVKLLDVALVENLEMGELIRFKTKADIPLPHSGKLKPQTRIVNIRKENTKVKGEGFYIEWIRLGHKQKKATRALTERGIFNKIKKYIIVDRPFSFVEKSKLQEAISNSIEYLYFRINSPLDTDDEE